ncbi:YbaB/EbfC family nucleoid-associated protein [Phytomonospora endophytica]|uniref:DNA-binding protein YbaB n=1 Tax=Phytomonospora endophytica TaxID=714109 RepID=A0A841FDC8_9ACTN|nr:YbaB/EbfC family nucleoid-associated protein [Phytomonospora endophytica]MBB6034286.1 DNA-binding protein YbaB [Phytomonospora endophytica]GIG66680.1 hypothetical protein Pen01_29750 [Phytomonospora endophytica]
MSGFGDDVSARAEQVRRLVTEARTELSSEDFAVKVTVGPNGAVHDVDITGRAARYSAAELGELVVECLRTASARMSRELRESLAELMGGVPVADTSALPSLDEIRRMRAENRGETP